MEKLLEQLENNKAAVSSLDERYYDTLMGKYWNEFVSTEKKLAELVWVDKIKKRVLSKRHRILENIKRECDIQMNLVSQQQREQNLKNIAA